MMGWLKFQGSRVKIQSHRISQKTRFQATLPFAAHHSGLFQIYFKKTNLFSHYLELHISTAVALISKGAALWSAAEAQPRPALKLLLQQTAVCVCVLSALINTDIIHIVHTHTHTPWFWYCRRWAIKQTTWKMDRYPARKQHRGRYYECIHSCVQTQTHTHTLILYTDTNSLSGGAAMREYQGLLVFQSPNFSLPSSQCQWWQEGPRWFIPVIQ